MGKNEWIEEGWTDPEKAGLGGKRVMIEKESKETMVEILEKIIRVELDFISSSLNQAYKIGDDLQDIILEVTKSLDRISYFFKGTKYFKKRDRFDWRKWQEVGWDSPAEAESWYNAGWEYPMVAIEWYKRWKSDPGTAGEWFDAGWADPKKAKRWYNAGWRDPEEALEMYKEYEKIKEVMPWKNK